MKAKGLAWLGTRTLGFEATTRFFGETLGLHAELRRPRWQRLRDNRRRLTDVAATPNKGNPSCSTHE